jgi:flagellar basal body rod protein FlgG
MFLNSALTAALDRIAERASDVRRAFTPGALPEHDDVATPATKTDFTLDPLAVTAPDGAYFVIRDERGRYAYTRDGDFEFRDGRLVDRSGRTVCGARGTGDPVDLRADAVDVSLGRIGGPHIESDGTVTYQREAIDPRNASRGTQRVVVGRILLARFPAATRLENNGGLLQPRSGVAPQRGLPGEEGFGSVVPMHRERSHIDIDESLARLKEAYMSFEAIAAAEHAKAHLGKTAIDLLK